MNIIVTAGGTIESIDAVRSITNMSTGMLGAMIAEEIASKFEDVTIYFIGSSSAINIINQRLAFMREYGLNDFPRLKTFLVTNTESVRIILEELLTTKEIKSVVHAMAVSDYTVEKVFDTEDIINSIRTNDFSKQEIIDLLMNPPLINNKSKISSSSEKIDVRLKKTPKLIDMIKKISPDTQLIGFKLLNGVSHEELIKVSRTSLIKTGADYIIANDLRDINDNGKHTAYIVDINSEEKVIGKQKIAIEVAKLINEVNYK